MVFVGNKCRILKTFKTRFCVTCFCSLHVRMLISIKTPLGISVDYFNGILILWVLSNLPIKSELESSTHNMIPKIVIVKFIHVTDPLRIFLYVCPSNEETYFLTTFYGLYFSHHFFLFWLLPFFLGFLAFRPLV